MKFKSTLITGALLASLNVHAGEANNYDVLNCRIDTDGRGLVEFTQNLTNRPTCINSGYEKMLSFDVSTVGGKAIYAMCLEAKARDARIYAKGKLQCNDYVGVVEEWNWGKIID